MGCRQLLMRTPIWLMFAACLATPALAGESPRLSYRTDWPNGNPRALTLISARMPGSLFGALKFEGGVDWDTARSVPVPAYRERLCALTYPKAHCPPWSSEGLRVVETYLGQPSGWQPYGINALDNVGQEALLGIGDGATKVLVLTVHHRTMTRRSVTMAFDPVSDDELRDIALEDAVYRILHFRGD